MESITIGSGMTSIATNVPFSNCSKLKTVYIDSSTIAAGLSSQTVYGNLVNWANDIYILDDESITSVGSYVTTNFSIDSENVVEGYVHYHKN